jgi:hypothetical protein
MNTDTKNGPWLRAAKKRFPGCEIKGDGPIAVLNRPLHLVCLFAFELFAQQYIVDREERGDAQYCEMFRLQPDYGNVRNANVPLRVNADRVEREKPL